jgi:hypothetical protein
MIVTRGFESSLEIQKEIALAIKEKKGVYVSQAQDSIT